MINKRVILGLTGPTGAGKTTVSSAMERSNCFIINADLVAKKTLLYNKECINELVKEFGNRILDEKDCINRKVLANLAFKSKKSTEILNKITHPYIVKDIKEQIFNLTLKNDIIVLDAPLLIESKLNEICDLIICVICDKKLRLERIIKRDSLTEKEALMRINAQKNEEYYINNSDYILNGSVQKDKLYNDSQKLIKYIREEFYGKTQSKHF